MSDDWVEKFDQFSHLNGPKPMPDSNVSSNFYEVLYQAFRDRMLSEVQIKWKDHVEASGNEELIARLQQSHE